MIRKMLSVIVAMNDMVIRQFVRVVALTMLITGIISLSACRNNEKGILSSKSELIKETRTYLCDESEVIILDENDYANAQIISQTEYITFYKRQADIREVYPNFSIINIECPTGFIPCSIDEDGVLYGDYTISNNSEIVSYNYKTQSIITVIDDDDQSAIAMLCKNDNYIIYQKDNDYSWQSPEYHLYDLETKEDLLFYKSAINPITGNAYCSMHFNNPVIINRMIYYDDIIDIDDAKNVHRILYCYDIDNKEFKVIYDDAALPHEYMNKLSWFSLSNDGITGIFCNEQRAMFKPKSLLGSSLESCDNLIAIHDNISENSFSKIIKGKKINTNSNPLTGDPKDEATTSHGIKIIRDGVVEPVLLTGNNVVACATNISTNGRFVMWNGAYIGEPMFYDVHNDEIIKIDSLKNLNGSNDTYYFFKASRNKFLLCYGSYTDNLSYYIISLE